MADERLRRLARASPDDPGARARLLRERLRRGDLPRPHVRLAASLDDPAARLALSAPEPAGRLFVLLAACGQEVSVRLAVALAAWSLTAWEAAYPFDPGPREAVRAAEGWLGCPCADCAEEAALRARIEPPPGAGASAQAALHAARHAAEAAAAADEPGGAGVGRAGRAADHAGQAFFHLALHHGREPVAAVARRALVAGLLGESAAGR